ncbi:MAG: sensor histidine kinase [Mediterraneibacter sp.]
MGILAGILAALLLLQTVLFLKYQRQVKDICRQLAFLVRNDSNMMITSDIETGEIGKLKDSLNELISRQRREKNRYQEKEKMISEIYTSLSHDIRTPLTSLDGYFQLLETSEDPEEQSRYIQIIQERISSLKEMLEELFLFAKLKNDSYKIELSACCFSSILKQTVFSYYDEWQKRGLKPEIQIPEERLYFTGNEQALRRLIQNVIKNGLDHGKDKIGIRMYRKEGRIVLRISNRTDHPEQINISRVFERFYKADSARSRTSSGLGLSIARELAARMEGEMRAGITGDEFWIEAEFPEIQG